MRVERAHYPHSHHGSVKSNFCWGPQADTRTETVWDWKMDFNLLLFFTNCMSKLKVSIRLLDSSVLFMAFTEDPLTMLNHSLAIIKNHVPPLTIINHVRRLVIAIVLDEFVVGSSPWNEVVIGEQFFQWYTTGCAALLGDFTMVINSW